MNYRGNDVCQRIKTLAAESENYINLIYASPCIYTRNMLLNQLRDKINEVGFLSGLICQQETNKAAGTVDLPQQIQRELTLRELSQFNGKDGNPAYVAVNGIIYDVTDNAAWAAALHFGLTAGKELTGEFASCHGGQSILSKLKVVGKLI
ncbi:MAG TPA: cytochrome b5 domain-containing protein [Ruminiclostridium sp.]|nr:cytochrome b5 domain-containing protein [Ruminiclostridium sp.]